jgi:hypothetical protein
MEGMLGISPRVLTVRKIAGAWRIVPSLDLPNTEGSTMSTVFAAVCIDSSKTRVAPKK